MAEQEPGERLVDVDRVVLAQAPVHQPVEEVLDQGEVAQRRAQPGRGRRAGGDQREQLGVVDGDGADRVGDVLEEGLPAVGGPERLARRDPDALDELGHHGLEQVLATVDVVVERHRLDAQGRGRAGASTGR